MTPEQIKEKTDAKVKQITDLCALLQITLTPEEVMLQNGIIRKVIYYADAEDYPKKLEVKHDSTNQETVDNLD
jgi:hypothetical protein